MPKIPVLALIHLCAVPACVQGQILAGADASFADFLALKKQDKTKTSILYNT